MATLEHWVCPHCQVAQVVPPEKHFVEWQLIDIPGLKTPSARTLVNAYGCSNPDCLRLTARVAIYANVTRGRITQAEPVASAQLLPKGTSKPQPEYIPAALRDDYAEACAIREASPKASATLVRRCLQGMIRDFCGIQDKKTLYAEIEALRKMVDDGHAPSGVTAESVEAIDQVRGIGNIGAHMEHDINLIVDVDPDEAQMLIELVEMLFAEWYVARHVRRERLAKIRGIAADKQEARLAKPDEGAAAIEGQPA